MPIVFVRILKGNFRIFMIQFPKHWANWLKVNYNQTSMKISSCLLWHEDCLVSGRAEHALQATLQILQCLMNTQHSSDEVALCSQHGPARSMLNMGSCALTWTLSRTLHAERAAKSVISLSSSCTANAVGTFVYSTEPALVHFIQTTFNKSHPSDGKGEKDSNYLNRF